jgi:hypothetical protein
MSRRGLIIAVVVAVGVAVLSLLLLGLPGAILFEMSSPFIALLFGTGASDRLPPDSMWPVAIYITLLWPVSIVIGYLVAFRMLGNQRQWVRIIAFLSILYLWALLLSIGFYLLARS